MAGLSKILSKFMAEDEDMPGPGGSAGTRDSIGGQELADILEELSEALRTKKGRRIKSLSVSAGELDPTAPAMDDEEEEEDEMEDEYEEEESTSGLSKADLKRLLKGG
jgi:hypothetical protein